MRKMKRDPVRRADLRKNWHPKSITSARSGVQTLPDGRVHCWIEHETLAGVTPTMLVWWFRHLEGDMEYEGLHVPRYQVWHPIDHQQVRYARRLADGSVGVGAELHIRERLGGDDRYRIDARSRIVKLDESGFEHHVRRFGVTIATLKYAFESVAGGTRYRNSLTVGLEGRPGRWINPLIRRMLFGVAHGQAWIRHNVEEVGQFERFLPKLYALETGQVEHRQRWGSSAAASVAGAATVCPIRASLASGQRTSRRKRSAQSTYGTPRDHARLNAGAVK
ncbi:MAG: hypothetical protein AB7P21_17375 [Lautropia sp.]